MNSVLTKLRPSGKKFVIILILIVIFLGAAFYVYNKYVAPKLNPNFIANEEYHKGNRPVETAELYLIYATWCPYSKKVLPIWNELKEKYDRKVVNKYSVIFKDFDGDKQEKKLMKYQKDLKKKLMDILLLF